MEVVEAGVEDFLTQRTRRISQIFMGVLGIALVALIPVFFLVIHNVPAGIGAAVALVVCVVGLFLVRRGLARLGNAIFFAFCLLVIDAVAWLSHVTGEDLAVVLISVVGLTLVVLMPTGILVNPLYAVVSTVLAFALLVPALLVSGNPMLVHRIPLFAVVYIFAGAIIYTMSTVQDSLLRRAVVERQRSSDALASTRDTLRRVDETRIRVEGAQQVVAEQLDRISEIVAAYTDRVGSVSGGYRELAESVAGSRDELALLDDSVQLIAGHMKTQSDLVEKTASTEQEMSVALTAMSASLTAARDANDVLAASADQGRTNVAALVGIIDELKDYQGKLAAANQTIQRIGAQTNLLAMNASIEAAHAGVAGSGFSVVADEVRSLSVESNARTKEISALIRGMNGAIVRGVETIGKAGDSLLEVNHHAELSRPVVQELMEGMRSNLDALSIMSGDSRDLVAMTRDVEGAADTQQQVFTRYRQTFGTLSVRLASTIRQLQELQDHTEQARNILSTLGSVREENEELSRRIAELLGSKDNGGL